MRRDSEKIEVIEERLHDHERELARTLEAIREKMSSRELVGELYDRATSSGYVKALGRAVRDNPLPTVLAGVCAAWLAKSVGDAMASEREAQKREAEEGPTLSEVALADTAAGGTPGEERTEESAQGEGESEGGRVVLPPGSQQPDA